jgi:hypothetical protein
MNRFSEEINLTSVRRFQNILHMLVSTYSFLPHIPQASLSGMFSDLSRNSICDQEHY